MEWYSTTVGLITAFGTVIGLISRWSAHRAKNHRARVIDDWQQWAISEVGRLWLGAYINEHGEHRQKSKSASSGK